MIKQDTMNEKTIKRGLANVLQAAGRNVKN